MRAAVGAIEDGKNPIYAGIGQLFRDPESAPTAKDILTKAGVSDTKLLPEFTVNRGGEIPQGADLAPKTSAADSLSPAADAAMNVLNVIPAGGLITKGAEATKEVPVIGKTLGLVNDVKNAPSALALKANSLWSTVPGKAIETYSARGPAVNQIVDQSGGFFSNAADQMKEKVLGSIKEQKAALHDAITQTLARPENAAVRASPLDLSRDIGPTETQTVYPQVKTISGEMPPSFSKENPSGMNFGRQMQIQRGIDKSNLSIMNDRGINPYESGIDVSVSPVGYQVSPGSGGPYPVLGPQTKSVDITPVLQRLQKTADSLNPHYNPGDISQINELMDKIRANSVNGQMDPQTLFETKNFLQTRAQSSFIKDGNLFATGDKASKAANDARKSVADMLHAASPEIAHADEIYSSLHDIDDKISTALLGQGGSENVFASAGSGKGNHNAAALSKLDDLLGTTSLRDAENLYAAKAFKTDPYKTEFRKEAMRMILDAKSGLGSIPDFSSSGAAQAVKSIPTTAVERRLSGKRSD